MPPMLLQSLDSDPVRSTRSVVAMSQNYTTHKHSVCMAQDTCHMTGRAHTARLHSAERARDTMSVQAGLDCNGRTWASSTSNGNNKVLRGVLPCVPYMTSSRVRHVGYRYPPATAPRAACAPPPVPGPAAGEEDTGGQEDTSGSGAAWTTRQGTSWDAQAQGGEVW